MDALYKRLDAAVFYCASKKVSFGLQAYIAKITEMQRKTPGIWHELEADDRAEDLRNLVVDHYLPTAGPTSRRHFVVGQVQNLSARGQVMAAGSQDAARKRLAEDREANLRRLVKRRKSDLAKAEAALEEFLRTEQPATSGDAAAAGQPAERATPASRAAASKSPAPPSKRRRNASDEEDEEDDEDEDEPEGEGDQQMGVRRRHSPRPARRESAQCLGQGSDEDGSADGDEDWVWGMG